MPCAVGSSPVRKVGHTAPLPIKDGERTSSHLPSASKERSAGNSFSSINCRTSVDSAASMPIARTDGFWLLLTKQLLGVDSSLFRGGSNTSLKDSHRLQIVTAADFRLFAVN